MMASNQLAFTAFPGYPVVPPASVARVFRWRGWLSLSGPVVSGHYPSGTRLRDPVPQNRPLGRMNRHQPTSVEEDRCGSQPTLCLRSIQLRNRVPQSRCSDAPTNRALH